MLKNDEHDDPDAPVVSYHAFPLNNAELCQKWICANPCKDFVITKNSKLCSLHFHSSDFVTERMDRKSMGQSPNFHQLVPPRGAKVHGVFLIDLCPKIINWGDSLLYSLVCINHRPSNIRVKVGNLVSILGVGKSFMGITFQKINLSEQVTTQNVSLESF